MESKWPFMMITFGLLFALGVTISKLEKTTIMNNWTDRRCDLPVMVAAAFFKPDLDSRSSTEFAKDNFEFCIKSTVEKFVTFFMGPINSLFGKQVNAAGDAVNMVNTVRDVAQTLYNAFLSYLDIYYRKFNESVFEMSRVVQHLRMAMGRANAIAVSMIYTGITLFRGIINSIQLVIRVVLIICGIMLAIIIILWFILFPIIPIILATLAAIVSAVLVFTGILSDSISADANDKMGGFCFAADTPIVVCDSDGKEFTKQASDIKLGDQLARDGGRVTTVILMEGRNVPLYTIDGIYVSGSHLVKGTDGEWRSVSEDVRAVRTEQMSDVLYCFNTTSNNIPVLSNTESVIWFRDWEEIKNDDEKGQYMWNYLISKILHSSTNYKGWKSNLTAHCETAIVGKRVRVKTIKGWIPIAELSKPFGKVVDRNGNEQDILGIIYGEVENAKETNHMWNTELYVWENGIWIKSKNTVQHGTDVIDGMTLITENGEFIIWDELEQREKCIRDFTEVGYQTIHETYPFVEARLRTMK
jgi:hypothetical protein